jgi:peptide/nickel transport system ATP-binding protein
MPYTLGLLGSLPRVDATTKERLTPILGSPPSLLNMPPGCPFAPRCPLHVAACDEDEPPLFDVGAGHSAACIRTDEVARAHGHAAEVFSETADDRVLAGESLPADLATAEGAGDAAVPGTPPAGQTEAGTGRADTGSVVSTEQPAPTSGTTNGERA